MRMIVLLLMAAMLAGCGATGAQKLRSETLAALDGAASGFQAWDKAHQEAIVEAPGATQEIASARIAAYRKAQEKVLACFTLAYTAVSVVDGGGKADEAAALANVLQALQALEVLP